MLNIALTFDYELFFGENFYSENEVLFEPTKKVSDLLNEYKISGTFYADVSSVFAYKRERPESDYPENFKNQLVYLKSKNQDIQLHIHSHWETAKWKNKRWDIDEETYKLHYFIEHRDVFSADQIIRRNIKYLYDTVRGVESDYNCISFRAGGFCIQPIDVIGEYLREAGIKIDSSVAVMQKFDSNVHSYNYVRKYEQLNWNILNGIYEIPVGAVKNNIVRRVLFGNEYKTLHREIVRGTAIHASSLKKYNKWKYFLNYGNTHKMMSLDSMPYKQLVYGLNKYYKKYDCMNKESYVAIICHPKCVDNLILENMKMFIETVQKQSNKFRFLSITQMYEEMKRG